jgi:hypothetical protein
MRGLWLLGRDQRTTLGDMMGLTRKDIAGEITTFLDWIEDDAPYVLNNDNGYEECSVEVTFETEDGSTCHLNNRQVKQLVDQYLIFREDF